MELEDLLRDLEEHFRANREDWSLQQCRRAILWLSELAAQDRHKRGRPRRKLILKGAFSVGPSLRSRGRPRAFTKSQERERALFILAAFDQLRATYIEQGIRRKNAEILLEVNRSIASELGLPTEAAEKWAKTDTKRLSDYRKLVGISGPTKSRKLKNSGNASRETFSILDQIGRKTRTPSR